MAHLLSSPPPWLSQAALINRWAETRLREWPGALTPQIPLPALIAASTAMNLGLVRWWLKQNPRPPPNDMAVIQQRLQTTGVLPLLGLETAKAPRKD